MEAVVGRWLAPLKFQLVLVALFAVFALTMAALGIYGVISYVVGMRTNEIGVRMALGAQPGQVFRSVVGQGLLLAGMAVPLGIGGAVLLSKSVSAILYRVSPTDVSTFTAISILVVVVAGAACYLPARRAMRVDPMTALRWE
jgi:putative ABC transport system permease protein